MFIVQAFSIGTVLEPTSFDSNDYGKELHDLQMLNTWEERDHVSASESMSRATLLYPSI